MYFTIYNVKYNLPKGIVVTVPFIITKNIELRIEEIVHCALKNVNQ